MPIEKSVILQILDKAFPNAEIDLIDTVGDMNHYDLTIRSEKFNGLNLMKQHKIVLDALGDMVGSTLHAISIKTLIR